MANDDAEAAQHDAAVKEQIGVPITREPVTLVLTGERWTRADGTVHYVTRCGCFRPEQLADWHLTLVPTETEAADG